MGDYLTSRELAKRLAVTEKTIIRWRSSNIGPPFIRIGGTIRYKMEDVLEFEKQARVQTTKDT